MKSFEQVTSEVFDRSRQRIIKAKRRNKIILSTVSAAACVALCVGVLALKPWSDVGNDRAEGFPENSIVDVTDESSFSDSAVEGEQTVRYYYTSLKVVSSELVGEPDAVKKDLDQIEHIALTLQDFFSEDFQQVQGTSDNLKSEYEIVFDTFDGREETFILKGNTLCGNVNGVYKTVMLTDTQLEELKTMLDIP